MEPPFETPANFVNFGPSGVCHYRTILPSRETRASMFIRHEKDLRILKEIGPQDPPVVVYSMPRGSIMRDEVGQLQKAGVKVIADIDDYLPAFIGKADHPGAAELYTQEFVDRHLECVAGCDLVTTTTPWLAKKLESELDVRTVLCPNALDIERWNIRKEQRHKKYTIIGWSGSIGHTKAMEKIAPVLNQLLRERDDIAFCTAGMPGAALIDEDLRHRIHDTGFHPIAAHPRIICQFHINIGPTLDDDFYAAKSPLRCLESWASDSAFIGGANTYGGLVRPGIDGLLADTPDEWYAALTSLLDDRVLSQRLRKNGGKRVRAAHLMANTGPDWRAAVDLALR